MAAKKILDEFGNFVKNILSFNHKPNCNLITNCIIKYSSGLPLSIQEIPLNLFPLICQLTETNPCPRAVVQFASSKFLLILIFHIGPNCTILFNIFLLDEIQLEELNNYGMILFIRWILSICLAYPLSACRWYPIPINFNDERGQFNTSWTHCSKVVGNKSYALVTEKCMTQISAGVICYTPACPSTRLPSLRCIRAHAHTHTHICTLHALQLGNAISF